MTAIFITNVLVDEILGDTPARLVNLLIRSTSLYFLSSCILHFYFNAERIVDKWFKTDFFFRTQFPKWIRENQLILLCPTKLRKAGGMVLINILPISIEFL